MNLDSKCRKKLHQIEELGRDSQPYVFNGNFWKLFSSDPQFYRYLNGNLVNTLAIDRRIQKHFVSVVQIPLGESVDADLLDQKRVDGELFYKIRRRSVEFLFDLKRRRPLILTTVLRLQLKNAEGVRVYLNGSCVGRWEGKTHWYARRLSLPARIQKPGENRLVLKLIGGSLTKRLPEQVDFDIYPLYGMIQKLDLN